MLKKKINAIYSCCTTKPWLDVSEKLLDELNIIPKYFISWDDGDIEVPKKYPNCFFQNIRAAWNGKGFPELDYKYPLDEKFLKSVSYEKVIAIKMMDRLDLNRYSFNYSDRQTYFYYLLKIWLVILDHYKIDIVISPNVPHRVFDYVLYVAAKVKNLEVVMFQELTSFNNLTSIVIDDIDQTPNYLKNEIKNLEISGTPSKEILDIISLVQSNYKISEAFYMKNLNKKLSKNYYLEIIRNIFKRITKPNYTNDSLFDSHKSSHIFENIMPFEKKGPRYRYLFERYKNFSYIKNLKNLYKSLTTKNFSKKYIFVAFHYQPEATSMPTGGIFANQELIINLLDSFLDKDIDIIVKEHKQQFNIYSQSASGRGINFYKNIMNISSRVKFVDVNHDPFDLIDKALATATISSTIGWESVIRGTPSLIFGRAWYEDMVGVYKIKTIENLKDNWREILNIKNNINKNEILSYHSKIERFLVNGKYGQNMVKSILADDQTINNIFNGVKNHLIKKNFI